MAIIWCGGEDIDFPNGGSSLGFSTSYRRSDFVRGSLTCAISAINPMKSKQFQSITSGWLSFRCYLDNVGGTHRAAGFANHASGYKGIYVGGSSVAANKLGLWKYDETWTLLASEEGISLGGSNVPVKFDLQIENYGVLATVKIYKDGSLLIDYSGDISISGVSNFDVVSLIGAQGDLYYFSEFIVADEDTRLLSLKTLAPDAAGDVSDWNGAYTTIDELTNSDADLVYTDQFDKDFMCNLTGMPAGDFICKGVKIAARVADGVGGIGVQLGIKTNATVDVSATHELEGAFETIEQLYQQNPITSNRFTPADIEALQAVLRSKEVV